MSLPGKWLVRIFIGLLALSQFQLWSDNRLFHIHELHQANLESQAENARLIERNRELEVEIASLKTGFEAVEKEAREELGLVREGETFFRFTNNTFQQNVLKQ